MNDGNTGSYAQKIMLKLTLSALNSILKKKKSENGRER